MSEFGDALNKLRKEREERDDTRWKRAMQAVKAGNTAGALAILNERDKKYSQILPREDGGISVMRSDGGIETITPDALFYASTGQIKDPTEQAIRQTELEINRQKLSQNQKQEPLEVELAQQRVAGAKEDVELARLKRKLAEETAPDEKRKLRAQIEQYETQTGLLSAEGERNKEKYEYGVKQRPFEETAAQVELGLKVDESQAKTGALGQMKPGEKARLTLAESKEAADIIEKVYRALSDPPEYDAALALLARLPPDILKEQIQILLTKQAAGPGDVKTESTMWPLKKQRLTGEAEAKQMADLGAFIDRAMKLLPKEEGESTTGLKSATTDTGSGAQMGNSGVKIPPMPHPRPAPPPPAPMAPASQPQQTPAPAVNFGVTGMPGPMAEQMQVPSKPPTMIPQGPQVKSPQTGPTMSAMAAGGDKTDLKQVLLQNVRLKLMTPEQAANIARQAGVQ